MNLPASVFVTINLPPNLFFLFWQVIDAYLSLIQERSNGPMFPSLFVFSSFFCNRLCRSSYAGQRHTIKVKKSIFQHDLVVIPINVDQHWILALLDMRHKKINLYDSLGGKTHDNIIVLQYGVRETTRTPMSHIGLECWVCWHAIAEEWVWLWGLHVQNHGVHCKECSELEMESDMTWHRKLMAHELVSGKLFPSWDVPCG